MSQSPLEATAGKDYLEGWSATYELLRQGKSWSGHETNNAFLNLGGGRFVDISAVAGLDYADDGRALAVVDWDQDGALDLVTSNRTGPQLRFLGNRNAGGGHFLALRLEGRRSNRDAIGARVELFLAGGRRLVRAVRAGDGYLGQSSRWLHFGLGATTAIDRIRVRWPSGLLEEVRGLDADRWYTLREGSGSVEPWQPRARRAAPVAARAFAPHAPLAPPSPPGRTYLLHPLPLFEIPYRSVRGEPVSVPEDLEGPVLINLWASWCANCRSELSELQKARSELAAARVDVLALTVDAEEDLPAAEAFLDGVGWSFPRGRAEPELLDVLNLAYEVVVDQPSGMAVPMSFLIDREHRLVAIYRGPVTAELVLEDVRAAERGDGEGALPFGGRWAHRPAGRDLQRLANLLRSHGYGVRAAAYLDLSGLSPDAPRWRREALADARVQLGRSLVAEGRYGEAEEVLRSGLAADPDHGGLLHELGRALLEQGKPEASLEHLEGALEQLPEDAALSSNLGLALARLDRAQEAAEHFHRALALAAPGEDAEFQALYNLAVYDETRGRRAEALERLGRCLEMRPEDFEALRFLGVVEQRAGRFEAAAAAYLKALEQEPDDARTVFYLGQAYISSGNADGAALQYERLLDLGHPSSRRLLKDLEGLKSRLGSGASTSPAETP